MHTAKGLRGLIGGSLALCLVATGDVAAFSDCELALTRLRLNQVEEAASIEPERLAAREVMGPPPDMGVRVAGSAPVVPRRRIVPSITRRLNELWRIRVPRSVDPKRLIVTHRLAGNGTARLVGEAPGATMDVRIRPLPPVVRCRNASDQIVEGSAELLVQFDALPLAGRYIGTIETSVRVP